MSMKDKARRRALAKKYTEDGLPRDSNEWTEEDWRDLHNALETIKKKVGQRHDRRRVSEPR